MMYVLYVLDCLSRVLSIATHTHCFYHLTCKCEKPHHVDLLRNKSESEVKWSLLANIASLFLLYSLSIIHPISNIKI